MGKRPHSTTAGLMIANAASRRAYSSPTSPSASAATATFAVEELESFVDSPNDPVGSPNDHAARQIDGSAGVLASGPVKPFADFISPVFEEQEANKEPPQGKTDEPESPGLKITRHLVKNGLLQIASVTGGVKSIEARILDFEELLQREYVNMDWLYAAYCRVPEPRVRFMSRSTVAGYLTRLRRVHVKDAKTAKQYFSVMDDMVRSSIPPSVRDFTSALVFVGRVVGVDPKVGLEKALDIFNRMELYGHRRADAVTFNTLGDLALRARRFDVFRSILKEMVDRELSQDRYTCLLEIRYWGLRKSPDQLKRTYRNMIARGEIIDTIVLNCVIRYLVIAGDTFTAEKTFERMKEIDGLKSGREKASPPETWENQSRLAKILRFSSWSFRGDAESIRQLQDATPMSPNTYTYRMIIRHHCFTTNNLNRVIDLLGEMQDRGLFITRPIFYMIFAAFALNKTAKFSPWNGFQLEAIFELFMRYVELSQESEDATTRRRLPEKYDSRCDFNGRTVEVVLRAYAEHTNGARVRNIWEQIRPRWRTANRTIRYMDEYVEKLQAGHLDRRWKGRPLIIVESHADMMRRYNQWDEDDEAYRTDEEGLADVYQSNE